MPRELEGDILQQLCITLNLPSEGVDSAYDTQITCTSRAHGVLLQQ